MSHGQTKGHTGTTQITFLKKGDKQKKLPACLVVKLVYFLNLNAAFVQCNKLLTEAVNGTVYQKSNQSQQTDYIC